MLLVDAFKVAFVNYGRFAEECGDVPHSVIHLVRRGNGLSGCDFLHKTQTFFDRERGRFIDGHALAVVGKGTYALRIGVKSGDERPCAFVVQIQGLADSTRQIVVRGKHRAKRPAVCIVALQDTLCGPLRFPRSIPPSPFV